MSVEFVQSVWTVIAMVVFIAIVIWAFSGARKKDFDEASRLPLDDDGKPKHFAPCSMCGDKNLC